MSKTLQLQVQYSVSEAPLLTFAKTKKANVSNLKTIDTGIFPFQAILNYFLKLIGNW